MLYYLFKIILAPFVLLFMRAKVTGWKKLFRKGPMIVVCNHLAAADPVLLGAVSPRVIRFMAKKELFGNKIISFILAKLLLCFPVDQQGTGLDSIRKAMTVLQEGKTFGIFPEGRRSVTGSFDSPEKGAAFLALRSGAPIVPVWMDPECYRHFRIHMRVGDCIDAKALVAQQSGRPADIVTRKIRDCMISLALEMEAE